MKIPPGEGARAVKRAARGRTKLYDGELTKITLSLDPRTIEALELIGRGNRSHAVRLLVAEHQEEKGGKWR